MDKPKRTLPDEHNHDHAHGHVGSPFPLDHADASRFKAEKQLLALEDHIRVDPCPACMNKHLTSAVTFLEEASGLDAGTPVDAQHANEVESVRKFLGSGWGTQTRWLALPTVRRVRGQIAKQIGHA